MENVQDLKFKPGHLAQQVKQAVTVLQKSVGGTLIDMGSRVPGVTGAAAGGSGATLEVLLGNFNLNTRGSRLCNNPTTAKRRWATEGDRLSLRHCYGGRGNFFGGKELA